MPKFPEAADLPPDALRAGLTASFERDIAEEDVLEFAALSGDANPLHVDSEYAAGTNFGGRIVHGAFQVALASAMIGMHLPGRRVLLGSVNARFPKPLYFPSRVRVTGTITAWTASARAGALKVTVVDIRSELPTAEVFLGFTLHEERTPASAPAERTGAVGAPNAKVVLVTGASGGLGGALVADLSRDYIVAAHTRREPFPEGPNVLPLQFDMEALGWQDTVTAALAGRRLYAVVHTAWPGQPRGGLLETETAILEEQLRFGAARTVDLARLLAAQASDPEGGRLIVLGSIVSTHKPVLGFAAYSLGKATVEHTVRLLAPELARRQITANVISPSFIPTGMNRQSTDRQRLKETALVPLGRVCEPADVIGAVRYLLSPSASFVSGQTLVLSGAQL